MAESSNSPSEAGIAERLDSRPDVRVPFLEDRCTGPIRDAFVCMTVGRASNGKDRARRIGLGQLLRNASLPLPQKTLHLLTRGVATPP